MAKVLQEKISNCFLESKIIFIHEKKRQRSKYTSKTFEIKKCQKSKNVALGILKFGIFFFFKYEKKFCFSKERGFFRLLFLNEIHRETIVVNFGKIQGQFVILVFKSLIRKWSQI